MTAASSVAARRSNDAELIAADAGDKIVAAQCAGQPLRDERMSSSPIGWPSVSLTSLK
jgi:hypothetical protein